MLTIYLKDGKEDEFLKEEYDDIIYDKKCITIMKNGVMVALYNLDYVNCADVSEEITISVKDISEKFKVFIRRDSNE